MNDKQRDDLELHDLQAAWKDFYFAIDRLRKEQAAIMNRIQKKYGTRIAGNKQTI